MIILTTQAEYAAIAYSLGIMSDSVKKMVKKRYKAQKADMLKSYRAIFDRVKAALASDVEQSELYLDKFDVQLLYDFLDAYLDKMHAMELHKQKITPEQRKHKEFLIAHLKVLDDYKKRLYDVSDAYEVS